MMNSEISENQRRKLHEIIAKILDVSLDQLTPEALLVEDLGADSLDHANIGMEMEDVFNITIPEDDNIPFKSVGDVEQVLARLLTPICPP